MNHAEAVIARQAVEEGRGLVVVVNKMDLLKGRKNSKLYDDVLKAVPAEIQTLIPQENHYHRLCVIVSFCPSFCAKSEDFGMGFLPSECWKSTGKSHLNFENKVNGGACRLGVFEPLSHDVRLLFLLLYYGRKFLPSVSLLSAGFGDGMFVSNHYGLKIGLWSDGMGMGCLLDVSHHLWCLCLVWCSLVPWRMHVIHKSRFAEKVCKDAMSKCTSERMEEINENNGDQNNPDDNQIEDPNKEAIKQVVGCDGSTFQAENTTEAIEDESKLISNMQEEFYYDGDDEGGNFEMDYPMDEVPFFEGHNDEAGNMYPLLDFPLEEEVPFFPMNTENLILNQASIMESILPDPSSSGSSKRKLAGGEGDTASSGVGNKKPKN